MMKALSLILLFVVSAAALGQTLPTRREPTFYRTAEARRIGEQVLLYQRVTGGWPKNIDMARPMTGEERAQVVRDSQRRDDSTIDNSATYIQMTYLARLYEATGERRYKEAFVRGLEYLLSGQYANGGWPQYWPQGRGYHLHVTFNDDAMVGTMTLLRDVAAQKAPYRGLASKRMRRRLRQAFGRGLDCILAAQIRDSDGKPTVWCQQHDRETLAPAPARSFELAAFCSDESAGIVRLLMQLPDPDERVREAVYGAMRWFESHRITGVRLERYRPEGSAEDDLRLVADATAAPLWARYYDLQSGLPFFCDRDGIPRPRIEDIGRERRNGYKWYCTRPSQLFPLYEEWCRRGGHREHHRSPDALYTLTSEQRVNNTKYLLQTLWYNKLEKPGGVQEHGWRSRCAACYFHVHRLNPTTPWTIPYRSTRLGTICSWTWPIAPKPMRRSRSWSSTCRAGLRGTTRCSTLPST